MKELRVVVPTGAVGFGQSFKEAPFYEAVKTRNPDLIAAQGASADCGPLFWGAPVLWAAEATRHDVEHMLVAARELDIPVIFGGVMGSGRNIMVDRMVNLIKEIAAERKLRKFEMAVIYSDVTKDYLKDNLRRGKIKRFGFDRDLTSEEIDRSTAVTAMMGSEPIVNALNKNVDVIVTGRCTDPANFVSLPLKKGFNPGIAWHFAKTIECGTACCERARGKAGGGGSTLVATLSEDHFTVEAVGDACATLGSVISHTLYERSNPYFFHEPGGMLDLTEAKFEQVDQRTVKASGAKWVKEPYTVVLEGVTRVGYRSIAILGARDPLLIKKIDEVLRILEDTIRREYKDVDFQSYYHVYGKNAIMKNYEPLEALSHELAIVMEVVCRESLELASRICFTAQAIFQHTFYEGILQTSGNACCLGSFDVFTPHLSQGVAYNWNILDLLSIEDPLEPFPMKIIEV